MAPRFSPEIIQKCCQTLQKSIPPKKSSGEVLPSLGIYFVFLGIFFALFVGFFVI
jgi:hypothetical protein